jgi:hypothetical protein
MADNRNYSGNRKAQPRSIVDAKDRKIVAFPGVPGFKATWVKITVFHAEKSCYMEAQGTIGDAPLVIGSHYSGIRLQTSSVSAFVTAQGFDPKKGADTTESKNWIVDRATGVKKALTSNEEWFSTFEFGSKSGAVVAGDEDATFGADAVAADVAFGK